MVAVEKDKIANMVVEIPKNTEYKLEIQTDRFTNNIMHDIKDGKVRKVNITWKTENNTYPAHYGALPQTWENPNHIDKHTGMKGDNDPIDAFDISELPAKTGNVRKVKILGVFAMIDAGETDWKVITISINDPKANQINNLADIEREMPGKLTQIYEFLRDYKMKSANDEANRNKFAFEGKPQERDLAVAVINQTHNEWRKLRTGQVPSGDIKIESPQQVKQKMYASSEKWDIISTALFPGKLLTQQKDECTIL